MFGVDGDSQAQDPLGKGYYIVADTPIDDTHLELTEPYKGNIEDPNGTVYNNRSYVFSDFVWYGHGQTANYTEAEEYIDEDVNLPEWGIRHATSPGMDNKKWLTPYRECCTANSWAGFVLAAYIIDAKSLWNHDVLFGRRHSIVHM